MSFEERLKGDFFDIVSSLHLEGAEFIIVGAYAVGVHVTPRATGDLDVWVRASEENAVRVHRALLRFGAPLSAFNVTPADFAKLGSVYQMGVAPGRIDIITQLSGITFDEAWPGRVVLEVNGVPVPFLGREALIKNKRAAARPKDLLDVEILERAKK